MAEAGSNPIDETPRIFWSWQSDKSPKTCRSFIRQCLADAINDIASDHDLHDADRPSIDHDTKGERGMADITNTILNKIADAAVFVADLTPIAQSEAQKWLPNPNVMIELGWAMHRPRWERVFGVLNTAHGASVEDLPFDIRQRRIITYVLKDGSGVDAKKVVREKLMRELKAAILVNLEDRAEDLAAAINITGVAAKEDNPSIWATAGASLIHGDAFGRSNKREIGIPDVPRAYMRVIPSGWSGDAPSISDIAKLHQSAAVDAPSTGASDGDFGATEEGYVRYWVTDRPGGKLAQASGMTMYFEDTGEFWTLYGNAVADHNGQLLIRDQLMLVHWLKTLRRSMKLFDQYGARKARLVEAGLFGVKDAKWFSEWESDRPNARRNDAKHLKQSSKWNEDAQLTFLTDAYNKVKNLFALERATEAQIVGVLKQFDPERFNEIA